MELIKDNKAIILRRKVDKKSDYHDYKEDLRYDFWYSCAYCSITEIEAMGIGFEIDHYYPKKANKELVNEYNNLMWSCQKCNNYKSDHNPDENDKRLGNIVIRCDQEDPSEHFDLKESQILVGKTHTGEFNIELLELNRLQLRRLRRIRKKFSDSKEYLKMGIQALTRIKLDEFDPNKRVLLMRIKKKVLDRNENIGGKIASILKEFAKSSMLDEDKEKKSRLNKRKKYLKSQKAIIPIE